MTNPSVTSHDGRHGELTERILSTLAEDGKPTAPPRLEDLRALDQFHNRGHEATTELALILAAGEDDPTGTDPRSHRDVHEATESLCGAPTPLAERGAAYVDVDRGGDLEVLLHPGQHRCVAPTRFRC